MKQHVLITDLTRMRRGRVCVAGFTSDGACVRPCLKHRNLDELWLWNQDTLVVRPFAVVELDLLSREVQPPHTEDWTINPAHRVFIRILPASEQESFLQRVRDASVAEIFGAEMHFKVWDGLRKACWIESGQGKRSLGTVGPVHIQFLTYELSQYNKWQYRLSFSDQTDQRYDLAVTDLAFRAMLTSRRELDGLSPQQAAMRLKEDLQGAVVYLRIGLARAYPENQCYLQVTGVYSFPDYLDGRSFADLSAEP
jgi:hypothetical protein